MKRVKTPSLDVDVDPILAAIAGAVIVLGGGAAAYGATRDTEPRSPAPAVAQPADPVVARALKIVSRTDGTVPAADAAAAADEARAARAASARGRGANPFPTTKAATASSGGSTTPGTATNVAAATTPSATSGSPSSTPPASTAATAKAQAEAASSKSDAANAAVQAATGGRSSAKTAASGASAADRRAAARRRIAAKPAKVTLRVVSVQRRTTMNKRSLGLLVPSPTTSVARVVDVSESNRVVVLRLRTGAALTGKQSPGTRCVERVRTTGACRLITVHTGNAAVIKAPRTPAGRPGAVTALRVLSVWRGGTKVAD